MSNNQDLVDKLNKPESGILDEMFGYCVEYVEEDNVVVLTLMNSDETNALSIALSKEELHTIVADLSILGKLIK